MCIRDRENSWGEVEYRMPRRAGRHFLQIPGPTNVPDRVLRAIDLPTMDHRGPEFAELGKAVLAGMKRVFKSTQGEVVIYPCLLYTSDAADERSSVDLGGRRIIKKK